METRWRAQDLRSPDASPQAPPPHLRICWAVEPSRSPLLGPASGPAPVPPGEAAAAIATGEAEDSGAWARAGAGTRAQVTAPWPSRTRPERTRLRFLRLRELGSFPEPLPGLHTCLGVTRATGSPPPPACSRFRPPRPAPRADGGPRTRQPMGFSGFASS